MNILVFAMDNSEYENSRSLEIHLCDELARQGNRVDVICEKELYYAPGEKPENLYFQVLNVNNLSVVQLEEYHRPCGAVDVVFATSISGAAAAVHFARLYSCRSVVQVLDIPRFRWKYAQYKLEWEKHFGILAGVDMIIANTRVTVNILHDVYNGSMDEKVMLVHYGVDSDMILNTPDEERVLDVILVQRLEGHRAGEKIIFALAELYRRGFHPSVTFIGGGSEMARMINLAGFAGVAINFVGGVSDREKCSLLKRSKVAVCTSVTEDISALLPNEAALAGCSVVCSDFPVLKECNAAGVLYVDPFDIHALADAILFRLQIPVVCDADWILKNRSIKVQAEKTMKIFEDVIWR